MHKISINKDVSERVRKRRNGEFAFGKIDPTTTALIAVDMQNWILSKASPFYMPGSESIVPRVNSIADTLRENGGAVVWVQMEADSKTLSDWSVCYDNIAGGVRDDFVQALTPGGLMHSLFSKLDVRAPDIISRKTRYSCILECSSDLHAVLSARKIDTLLIAGFVTNVCCETTARDAMMMGYKVIMLSDGCGARSDYEHNASLANLMNMFADIRSCEETAELLNCSE